MRERRKIRTLALMAWKSLSLRPNWVRCAVCSVTPLSSAFMVPANTNISGY